MAARSTDPFALPPIDEKTGGRVQVSFSGGRTSAYMLHRLIAANDGLPEDRVEVVFANTGREREATLAFVAEVAHRWGLMITWVEWRSQAPGFEVVGYQGAARAGEPQPVRREAARLDLRRQGQPMPGCGRRACPLLTRWPDVR